MSHQTINFVWQSRLLNAAGLTHLLGWTPSRGSCVVGAGGLATRARCVFIYGFAPFPPRARFALTGLRPFRRWVGFSFGGVVWVPPSLPAERSTLNSSPPRFLFLGEFSLCFGPKSERGNSSLDLIAFPFVFTTQLADFWVLPPVQFRLCHGA